MARLPPTAARYEMRLVTLENQERVFMNPHDYQVMLDSADSKRAYTAMRVMGECSCRVEEPTKIKYGSLRQSTHPDVDLWFMTVYGKDTKDRDTAGKRRDVWVPDDVKQDLDHWADRKGLRDDEPLFRCHKRTLQKDIEKTRAHAVSRTGNPDYNHISSHDFRAYFATNMTLRHGVNEEVVMELGGWDDRETFTSAYLNAQFDDLIQMHLASAGVIKVENVATLTEYAKIQKELQELREAIEDLDLNININGQVDADEKPSAVSDLSQFEDK